MTTTTETLRDRDAQFGANVFTTRPLKSYFRLLVEYIFGDIPLIIIVVTAIVSIGLAFFREPKSVTTTVSHVDQAEQADVEGESRGIHRVAEDGAYQYQQLEPGRWSEGCGRVGARWL